MLDKKHGGITRSQALPYKTSDVEESIVRSPKIFLAAKKSSIVIHGL